MYNYITIHVIYRRLGDKRFQVGAARKTVTTQYDTIEGYNLAQHARRLQPGSACKRL